MKKKAVVVGINDYAPIGSGGPDLNGCVNDARDMANTLVVCGFAPADIRILTNQNAKKTNIITYLNWLLDNAASGDSLVFFYSGHGTRVAKIGSDLEIDGLDEAIVPHDYASSGFIKDDDFRDIFKGKLKPGVNLEVIFDCCHSGTGTRNLNLALRELDGETVIETPRFLEPMLEDEFYFSYFRELETKASNKQLATSKVIVPVPGINHTLWAACKDNQVSLEGSISGVVRGYFTYHFCKILRATNGDITRKRLDAQTATALAAMGAAQTNQTESTTAEFSQKIFK